MDRLDAVVTGATGLVGRWLVPALTGRGRRVGVIVRGAAPRAEDYRAWIRARGGDPALVRFFDGDLAEADLGLSDGDRSVIRTAEDFFHLGAAMSFGLDVELARRVNVEGTRAFLELARSAPALRRVVHVGGFKVGGEAHAALDARTIAKLGGYEVSKIESDALVRRFEQEGLPVTRVQPGAIIGDSRTGETTQFWGFSDLVRDLFHGKLPAIVGGDGYWMPVVTVDYVAEFIARVPELGGDAASEYILIDDATPGLEELLERITRHLGVKPVRRVVPKGALEAFLRMGGDRLTGVSSEALSFIGRERWDLDATRRATRRMGLELPDVSAAVLRSVDYVVAARFGKQVPSSRAVSRSEVGHMKRVGGIPTFVQGDPSTCDLLFLHGIPLDASSWDGVVRDLPEGMFETARADLPGLARTTKTGDAPLVWMESLLAGNTKRPWLVGHSLGCRYAVEYAARHPDRIAGVILVAPFFLQGPPPVYLRNATIGSLAMALMSDAALAKLVGASFVDGPREWLSRPGARSRLAHALADAHAARHELGEKLRSLDVPVVIVTGDRDQLREQSDALPAGARLLTIPGTGHYPQLDTPAELATMIALAIAQRSRRMSPAVTSSLAA